MLCNIQSCLKGNVEAVNSTQLFKCMREQMQYMNQRLKMPCKCQRNGKMDHAAHDGTGVTLTVFVDKEKEVIWQKETEAVYV